MTKLDEYVVILRAYNIKGIVSDAIISEITPTALSEMLKSITTLINTKIDDNYFVQPAPQLGKKLSSKNSLRETQQDKRRNEDVLESIRTNNETIIETKICVATPSLKKLVYPKASYVYQHDYRTLLVEAYVETISNDVNVIYKLKQDYKTWHTNTKLKEYMDAEMTVAVANRYLRMRMSAELPFNNELHRLMVLTRWLENKLDNNKVRVADKLIIQK